MQNKKTQTFGIILIILFFINIIGTYFIDAIIPRFFPNDDYYTFKMNVYITSIVYIVIKFLLNIYIGIWLFRTTKKLGSGNHFFWTALGLVFGVFAIILYYLLQNEKNKIAIISFPSSVQGTENLDDMQ